MMTFRLPVLLALLVTVGLSGCVGNAETRRGGPQGAYSGPLVNFQTEVRPHVVGRTAQTEDGGVRIAWSGTSLTLRFRGSAVSVDITDNGKNQYLVLVDGKPMREKVTPVAGRSIVELVKGLPQKEHTITFYKLNEPLVGTATVHGFVLDSSGQALPINATDRPRLEIIGDSISTGYGNEGADETCGFSPETQNHFRTYGARAARELDAELTTIAWSGKGVFTNRGAAADPETLPQLWKVTLPGENAKYAFAVPPPRAVVINLGTNDFAPEVADVSPFRSSYDAFLTKVRSRYPDSALFVVVGPLLTDDYPPGMQALATARTALTELVDERRTSGDQSIHFLEFARPTPEEGFGCDYHPSAETHARMAATLTRVLREKAGFN